MAKYVELAGVPGVGKTTTCDFLQKTRYRQLEFYTNDAENFNTSGSKFLKNKILLKIKGALKPGATSIRQPDYLQQFVKENKRLNDQFWKALDFQENSSKRDLRFNTARYTANIFEKIQIITKSESGKVFIVDEGLIHCIANFICEKSDITYEQQLLEVLDMFKLPDAVVYFGGDVNIAVERTKNRKYQRESDKFLSPEELVEARTRSMKRKQLCIDLLIKRNVPVLSLDAKDNVKLKAQQIISFVHDIK